MEAGRNDRPVMSRARGRNILVAGATAVGAVAFGLLPFAVGAGLWASSGVGLGSATIMAGSATVFFNMGEPK